MAISRTIFPLSLPIALVLTGVASAQGIDRQCERSGMQRSVVVEYEDPDRRVPCEVVYRKPPAEPQVLWSARSEVGFCESKAQELLDTLEQAGWTCTGPDGDASPPTAAGLRPAEEPEVAPPPGPETGRLPEPEAGPAPRPAAPAATERPSPEADNAALDAAVARDLAKLDRSTDSKVVADSTAYGDLNDDGETDAAVVITFDADGADYVQYLVAYVFQGETYQPVASRLIGGLYREVFGGEVERIKDGTILLDLRILKSGDPSCCPSGNRSASFVLEDGELVDASEDAAAAAVRLKGEP